MAKKITDLLTDNPITAPAGTEALELSQDPGGTPASGAMLLANLLKLAGMLTSVAVTHNLASDADYNLTATQETYGRIIITDTGVLLTTGRNIVCSTAVRAYFFQNSTAQTLTLKTAAGTGVAVAAGQKTLLFGDGTNVVAALTAGTGDMLASTYDAAAGARQVAFQNLTLNSQADSYTLALSDAYSKYLRLTKATANNLTVPPNSSVAFAVGATIPVRQAGAGQVTVVQGAGVTVNAPTGYTLKLRGSGATASLIKVAADEWDLAGDLEATA